MVSIGLVANIYNECNALPGWLETHLPFFDDVRVLHAGPGGAWSDDGTMEILKKWRVPFARGTIDDGFGVCRTQALRLSPCEWVMLLDIDERFYSTARVMKCSGESTPHSEVDAILQRYDFRNIPNTLPDWEAVGRLGANLHVGMQETYNQGSQLRGIINDPTHNTDAVVTVRRHWHDFSFRRPTQNWHTDPDWQLRTVRNDPSIYFDPDTRMHERLVGANQLFRANIFYGPFFDHFHMHFKKMEQEQRSHDVAIYDAIHEGRRPPTPEEFRRNT